MSPMQMQNIYSKLQFTVYSAIHSTHDRVRYKPVFMQRQKLQNLS